MRACHCTLPYTNPNACERCSYVAQDGWWFIPFDPKTFDFEIGDDYYLIRPKKALNLQEPWAIEKDNDDGDDYP